MVAAFSQLFLMDFILTNYDVIRGSGDFIFKIVQEKYQVKGWEEAEGDRGGVMNVICDAATPVVDKQHEVTD